MKLIEYVSPYKIQKDEKLLISVWHLLKNERNEMNKI